MTDPVKPTRRYDSPRRRQQAAETRRLILEAAQTQFERDGYAATTMASIAREAGVAPKTVYVAFEAKSGVLRALWHLLLRGDLQDVPVGDRSWYREVLEEPDPERKVRMVARASSRVKGRAGRLMGVIRSAAATDPDMRELWNRIQRDFMENQRGVVESLHARGSLRKGLTVDRGADILWTLNHPDVWLLLLDRGWTPEEFEEWFADVVRQQLLD